MNDWKEGKFWKENAEANRQEELEIISPTIIEEADAESAPAKSLPCDFDQKGESAISGNSGIRGGQCNLSRHRDTGERFSGDSELGGGNDIIAGELVGVVSGDLLEIGNESGKEGQ